MTLRTSPQHALTAETGRKGPGALRRSLIVAVCVLLLGNGLFSGCQSLDLTVPAVPDSSPVSSPAEAAAESPPDVQASASSVTLDPSETPSDGGDSAPEVDPQLVANFRQWLDQDAWQVDVRWSVLGAASESCPTRSWRWIFVASAIPAGTGAAAKPDSGAADWDQLWSGSVALMNAEQRQAASAVLQSLQKESGRVGNNASILLARLQSDMVDATLLARLKDLSQGIVSATESVDATPRPVAQVALPLRCAAAEAWCRCLAVQRGDLHLALAPAGNLLNLPGLAEELRGTLWRTLAESVAPDRLPHLGDVLVPSADEQQRRGQIAALEACVISAAVRRPTSTYRFDSADWPARLMNLRLSDDSIVRRLVGRWAAWSQHPEALSLLTSQGRDADTEVQMAAIEGLGLLQTVESLKVLQHLARQSQDAKQAAAVTAIARWGVQELIPYTTVESSKVRVAVALGLRQDTTPAGLQVLRRLLTDSDVTVQLAAVDALRERPVADAVPLWLVAMEEGAFATRKAAQLQMSARLIDAPLLPVDGTVQERREAIHSWATQQGYSLAAWSTAATSPSAASSGSDQLELRNLLKSYLAPEAAAAAQADLLEQLQRTATARDVPLIEQEIQQYPGPAARRLQQELLPKLQPAYAALQDLGHAELQRRRDAARRIQRQAAESPLSPAVLQVMADLLVREQDHLVWQACLLSVAEDGHADANRLALLALSHVWPDLRRLGANHFERHPSPEAVAALLPLLQDKHIPVQLAAIRALQAAGNPIAIDGAPGADGQDGRVGATSPAGLRRLMTTADNDVRWSALTALAALGDDQAALELQRSLADSTASIRIRALQAMGDSANVRFIDPLMRLGWTEADGGVKQALLVQVARLVPAAEHPNCQTGLVAAPSIDDKIHCWVSWWDARRPPRQADSLRDGGEGTR